MTIQTTNTYDTITTTLIVVEFVMNEIWKCIEGFCGYYQVSNLGRIKSVERYVKCKNGALQFVKEVVKTNQLLSIGYFGVSLSRNSKPKTFYIHRLLAIAFLPKLKNQTQVNHIDGNKLNNNILNLEWCTPSENSQHAYDTGLSKSSMTGLTGSKCKNTKYSVIADNGIEKITMTGNKDMVSRGFNPSCINLCLSGKQKQHKGYFFTKVEL